MGFLSDKCGLLDCSQPGCGGRAPLPLMLLVDPACVGRPGPPLPFCRVHFPPPILLVGDDIEATRLRRQAAVQLARVALAAHEGRRGWRPPVRRRPPRSGRWYRRLRRLWAWARGRRPPAPRVSFYDLYD